MKKKVEPGTYSNGYERFMINKTDKDEVFTLQALTDVSYFPIKKGDTIPLNKGTIESLINDNELRYRKSK